MPILYKDENHQIYLKFNVNIDNLTDFHFVDEKLIVKKINFLKIDENTISIENNWFIVDREILNSQDLKIICKNIETGAYFYDEIFYDKSYFKHLVDLNKYENYPPYYHETYQKPGGIAVLSLASNDDIFIKIFTDYYKKITDIENIFIIDHGSNFKSEYHNCGAQFVKIPKGYESELNKVKFIETFQRFLLTKYDWVIKVDLDELIIYKNGPENIKYYLENISTKTIIRPTLGYNLIQNYHIEEDIDLSKPLTHQRKTMIYSSDYCKPSISNIPVNWSIGFHQCFNTNEVMPSDDFIMIHLAFVSINERYRRNQLFYHLNRTENELKIVGAGKTDTFDSIDKIKIGLDDMLKDTITVLPDWAIGQF